LKLQKLHIKNYKSLVDLEIVEPNPFTVFAGTNGAGKSNIFGALEFFNYVNSSYAGSGNKTGSVPLKLVFQIFDGSSLLSFSEPNRDASIELEIYIDSKISRILSSGKNENEATASFSDGTFTDRNTDFNIDNGPRNTIFKNFSRIFINNLKLEKIVAQSQSNESLSISAKNLEKVLKRLLGNKIKREDIIEYLELFVPGFEKIKISSDNLSGTNTLLIYEKGTNQPFTKDLISDGTYNILCLLTAVFQSDEPQFLCIEEPENGLNPYVIETLVELFRSVCEDKGHYIWLNTHSQTLVRGLKEEELILVSKEEGATQVKQFKKGDFYGLRADEAWLNNALGVGLPW